MKSVTVLVMIVACGVFAIPLQKDEKVEPTNNVGLSTNSSTGVPNNTVNAEAKKTQLEHESEQTESKDSSTNNSRGNSTNKNNDINKNEESNTPKTNSQVPQVIQANTNNEPDSELPKNFEGLELTDKIGTPAIISLQGPPGK